MSNFAVRTMSATVYAALVVSSILVHPYFFYGLFLILSLLTVREFMHLQQAPWLQVLLTMLLTTVLFCAYCYEGGFTTRSILAYLGILVISLVAELFLKAENPIKNWGSIVGSQIMLTLPFAMMVIILSWSNYLLLALFVIIWINDSGAYIIGSLMGKRKGGNHKMFPRVSPNKSWEGLIGGVVFAMVGGYVLYRVGWFDILSGHHALRFALVFAAVVSVFGTLGDLMESLYKRTLGIKDSGKLMPGHGGALDRFDSLLLATPAVYILMYSWIYWLL